MVVALAWIILAIAISIYYSRFLMTRGLLLFYYAGQGLIRFLSLINSPERPIYSIIFMHRRAPFDSTLPTLIHGNRGMLRGALRTHWRWSVDRFTRNNQRHVCECLELGPCRVSRIVEHRFCDLDSASTSGRVGFSETWVEVKDP